MKKARVLVGNSVWEDATLTIKDGWLFVEFDADDLDDVTIEMSAVPQEETP